MSARRVSLSATAAAPESEMRTPSCGPRASSSLQPPRAGSRRGRSGSEGGNSAGRSWSRPRCVLFSRLRQGLHLKHADHGLRSRVRARPSVLRGSAYRTGQSSAPTAARSAASPKVISTNCSWPGRVWSIEPRESARPTNDFVERMTPNPPPRVLPSPGQADVVHGAQ